MGKKSLLFLLATVSVCLTSRLFGIFLGNWFIAVVGYVPAFIHLYLFVVFICVLALMLYLIRNYGFKWLLFCIAYIALENGFKSSLEHQKEEIKKVYYIV